MASEWFYKCGQQRQGPVSRAALSQLAATGELQPADLVWTVGMSQWATASTLVDLFPATDGNPTSVATAVAPQADATSPPPAAATAAPISYYSPTGGYPPHALAALRGHARPTGDVYDWPLDDMRIQQFEHVLKIRKKIANAAQLYRLLLFLLVIVAVISGGIDAIALALSTSRATAAAAMGYGIGFLFLAAFSTLFFFAYRATKRSQRWAPLTMFCLFMFGVLANLLEIVLPVMFSASSYRSSIAPAIVGEAIGIIFSLIFAVVSWRAFTVIPKYLAQPAWCQELIVKANL